ncbi:MAG: hypothetical protein MRJ92_12680 [Nitrospira sp.]|nr:hypothetical protein [Nitrospira sp.]
MNVIHLEAEKRRAAGAGCECVAARARRHSGARWIEVDSAQEYSSLELETPLLAFTIRAATQSRFPIGVSCRPTILILPRQRGPGRRRGDRSTGRTGHRSGAWLWGALLQVLMLGVQGYWPEYVVTLGADLTVSTVALIDRCVATAIGQQDIDCVLTVTETREVLWSSGGRAVRSISSRSTAPTAGPQPLYEESSTVYVTTYGVRA